MANDQLPVTPALITWARERADFSIDEASKDFSSIAQWESGKGGPTYPQLEDMAKKFKIPTAVFFFPSIPDLPPVAQSFRTLPGHEFDSLPRRIKHLVRKGKSFQLQLSELAGSRNPASRLICRDLSFSENAAVSDMSLKVRSYLGINLEQQSSWIGTDKALKEWRRCLHAVGIYVFKDAFQHDSFSGFCLYDTEYPIVYVNNSNAKSRQIFTLFHELAHLLFETSGLDGLSDGVIQRLEPGGKQIEVLCNRFASEFLMPEEGFTAALANRPPSEEIAVEIAQQFHVSREVVFRRFLDHQLIDKEEYTSTVKQWAAKTNNPGAGGDYYNTTISYLGHEYIELAFRQFYRDKIDQNQLADALDIKPRNLSKFEDRFMKASVS